MENIKNETKSRKPFFYIKLISTVVILAALAVNVWGFSFFQKQIDELAKTSLALSQKNIQKEILLGALFAGTNVAEIAPVDQISPEIIERVVTRTIMIPAPEATPAPAPEQLHEEELVSVEETVVPLLDVPDEVNPPGKEQKAQVDQTVLITVSAPRLEDVYGYELKINYNPEEVRYVGGLKSSIGEIPTIFAKQFDSYVLVGATKIGKVKGYSASEPVNEVCTLKFTALKELDVNGFILDGVSVVSSDMQYRENNKNWKVNAVVVP